MRWSLPMIAGSLILSGAASAEPAKNVASEPAKATVADSPRASIVLASADPVRVSATDSGQPAASIVKRRVAPRITTCRCGPQQVQPQADPEDQ